ncbi:protein ANTAGONIST OF LIKE HETEROCHROMATIN PROTEIN 1-like [Leptopilina heterotoma]|uniref:protein ANTAGONIST OF LIKE HETEROCHROMATIN PROTEIN 1-like n=1 Tax=Leptopilina heterotoma TaxID=63436 RepID=UPI001CA893F7|nr:protein ANTAGONIST OF LIKE HETEROCHROMATIN PROTEIN 1-like [Leptopilina heterotoma]XP_043471955.1 protein ANTAGONIST OF LIKE HETEROCHROMATIN PROTEIN 1-like [Leptopilina heterotoma]
MLITYYTILIAFQWLQLLQRCLLLIYSHQNQSNRRWHVRPHITNYLRDNYGAYECLFLYYANSDQELFKEMCRLSVDGFKKLHDIVGPSLVKRSRRRPLSTEVRLAITLNYLAHGDSNRTLSNFFRVGLSTTYKIVNEVCKKMWNLLSKRYLRWKTPAEWKIVAQGFRVRWNFPNCIGAIDGKEIRIKAPPNSGSLFYNYKKFYSFKLLAICDAYYRFTWVDIGEYGSATDLSAFRNTSLFRALETENANIPGASTLPRTNIQLPHFFIGDEIFPTSEYLIKPFARQNVLTERQKVFNYRLSRGRNVIEDSFGTLVATCQILNQRLDCDLETAESIVKASLCLHNFIITEEIRQCDTDRRNNAPTEIVRNAEHLPHFHEIFPENVIDIREKLTYYFNSKEGQII